MPPTTAVCFDCDGTLLEFTRPYGEVVAATLTEHIGSAPDDLVRTYDEAFYGAFSALDPDPVLRGMRAVREAAVADGHGDPDPAGMVETLLAEERAMVRPAAGVEELLDALAEAGVHLGVVTNGVPDWQRAKLDHHGLTERFDAVVASYEAGAHKPDPAPYDLARERAPDSVERFVMVGDDFDPDVRGAREAGFEAVHLDRGQDAPTVPSLGALAALLSLS